MEASAPPHDFALIPTDFRNIVLSGTRQAFESCGARRSLETCARIVRFVDPFLSQGRLIRSFFFSWGLMAECDPPPGFRHPQHCCYMHRCASTCPFFTGPLNPFPPVRPPPPPYPN